MVRRKLRKKKNKKQIRIVLGVFICLLLVMTVGYAAFSTNISLNAKGNVKKQAAATMLKKKVVTSGDGLYADSTENNRYVYKGASPNNYICLASGTGTCASDDLYRIIALESDGTLKVIRNSSIGNIVWDPGYSTEISGITTISTTAGTRYSNASTDYCYVDSASNYYGCGAWGSKTSTYDSTGNNKVTSMPWVADSNEKYTLPLYDSYINVYLNGGTYHAGAGTINIDGWYASQNDIIKNNIYKNHIFNIGPLGGEAEGKTIKDNILEEKAYTWKGNIGLMNPTDYVRANTNSSNCGSVALTRANYSACSTTDWLAFLPAQWTMNPNSSINYRNNLWHTNAANNLNNSSSYAQYAVHVRPTLFLKSSITLSGEGTEQNPYTID